MKTLWLSVYGVFLLWSGINPKDYVAILHLQNKLAVWK